MEKIDTNDLFHIEQVGKQTRL